MKFEIGPPKELLTAIHIEVDGRVRAIHEEYGVELGRLAAECWAVGTLGFDAYFPSNRRSRANCPVSTDST